MARSSGVIYAHRGASLELPENTLEAFRRALDVGADAIETDAHLTRDGHVVLSHDPSGERMAGQGRLIREATLAETRTWDVGARFVPHAPGAARPLEAFRMPTLSEALEAFPSTPLNVDAKDRSPRMIAALLATVRAARATGRVRIASFSTRNLRAARALGYEGETGLSGVEIAPLVLLPFALARRLAVRVGGDAAQVPLRVRGITLASPRVIGRLHALGLRVDFWTINDPEQARALFAMGADGVMTDDPRKLCAAVGRPARSFTR